MAEPYIEASNSVTAAKFAEIDVTDPENSSLGDRFGIKGFPTLKYFTKGRDGELKIQDY